MSLGHSVRPKHAVCREHHLHHEDDPREQDGHPRGTPRHHEHRIVDARHRQVGATHVPAL